MITHRKVIVGEKAVDSPSYIVPVELEDKITIKIKKTKPKAAVIKSETVAEVTNG